MPENLLLPVSENCRVARFAQDAITRQRTTRHVVRQDDDGNVLTKETRAGATITYTPNALNQHAGVGPVSPSYDGNGNPIYDAEGHLTDITEGSSGALTAWYAYRLGPDEGLGEMDGAAGRESSRFCDKAQVRGREMRRGPGGPASPG